MGNPLAILVGAALVAAAVAFTFRWSIAVGPTNVEATLGGQALPRIGVYRLDRWTGQVAWCGQRGVPEALSAAPVTCEVKP
jgi:hypothetical protein